MALPAKASRGDQMDLFRADARWFISMCDMFSSGQVAEMGPHAYAVFCFLKSTADLRTGVSTASGDAIAEGSGVSRRQVWRAIARLEEMGYVTRTPTPQGTQFRLREQVRLLAPDRTPVGIASWDYRPAEVEMRQLQAELKQILSNTQPQSSPIINIHINNLQVQYVQGGQGIQVGSENLPADMLARIARMRSAGDVPA